MIKFKVFLFILFTGALVAALVGWGYVTSLRTVSFVLQNNVSVDVYRVVDSKKQNTIKSFDTSTNLSLQNGDYCAEPADSKYTKDPICFTVNDKDMSVDINPNYSSDVLKKILIDEKEDIKSVINSSYRGVIDEFIVGDGVLYEKGDWYGTTLTQKIPESSRTKGDIYRLVAKKENDTWKIINYPEISLSKFDYPDVPRNILDSINQLR